MSAKPKRRERQGADGKPAKAGRKTIFSPELATEICERLASPESLRSICADPRMPNRVTVARWMASNESFARMIAYARELQAEAIADEILAISDSTEGDTIKMPDGREVVNWENIQRSKLRCDARRWYLSKLAPKRYGEKVEVTTPAALNAPNQPLTEPEIAVAIGKIIDESEVAVGLLPKPGLTEAERIKRIIETERPVPPRLFSALRQWQANGQPN